MIAAERRQSGLTVVELEGPRLDAAGAESFRNGMRRIIDGGARRIAVDLGHVEFMDSTGLGTLVGCLKYMGEGGTIEIRRPSARVLKVLKLTRMDRVFAVCEAETGQGRARAGRSRAGRGRAGRGRADRGRGSPRRGGAMMSVPGTISPVMDAALGDARDIAGAVREVTGPRGLAGMASQPAPKALELMAMALTEVLQNILDVSGAQEPDGAAIELWVEPSLVVIAVRFAGPPLPDWLIANWDRGEPPAVLAPPGDSGWGWLVVREAFDSAGQQRARRGNLLFLEKRL